MTITDFQKDLNQGMTIQEALTKHNITLEKAFNTLILKNYEKKPKTTQKPRKTNTKTEHNILERNHTYALRKSINGRTRMFGTYNSREDAERMRQAQEQIGWKQTEVDNLCHELGIQRRQGHHNEKVRYH